MAGDHDAAPRSGAILLIEDEQDVREPNAAALERAGYRVVQAETWEQARTLTEHRHDVALIVTDLAMPGSAGLDDFSALRAEHGSPPVIVLSAFPRMMRWLDGVLDGVVRWLEKPVDVATLVNAVERAIDDADSRVV